MPKEIIRKKMFNYKSPYSEKGLPYSIPEEKYKNDGNIDHSLDKKNNDWGIFSKKESLKDEKIKKIRLKDKKIIEEFSVYPYEELKKECEEILKKYGEEIKELVFSKRFIFDETFEDIKKKNKCFELDEFKECKNIVEFLECYRNNKDKIKNKKESKNEKFVFFAPAGSGKSQLYNMNNLNIEDCVCMNIDLFRCFHKTKLNYIHTDSLTYPIADLVIKRITEEPTGKEEEIKEKKFYKLNDLKYPIVYEPGSIGSGIRTVSEKNSDINLSIVFTHTHNALERAFERSKENGRTVSQGYALQNHNNSIYKLMNNFSKNEKNIKNVKLYDNNGYFENGKKIKKMRQFAHYDKEKKSIIIDNIDSFLSVIYKNNPNTINQDAINSYELYRKNGKISYNNELINNGIKNLCSQFGSITINNKILIKFDEKTTKKINDIKEEIYGLKDNIEKEKKEKELNKTIKNSDIILESINHNNNLSKDLDLKNNIFRLKNKKLRNILFDNLSNSMNVMEIK